MDRFTIGTYEQVTFISDTPQEEVDRHYELAQQRYEAAKKEKADFEKNKFKDEYEAHRYIRPAITQTKRSDSPNPKPTSKSPWMTDEELAAFEESRKNHVKETHFDMEISDEETYIYKLDQLISSLTEFDFYNGDSD